MAEEIPPAAGLLMFSFICLNMPVSRRVSGALPGAPASAWAAPPAALASLARVASIRAADSAAKLVSTIGAAPLAITGGFFFDLVVVLLAAADLVVILVA